MSESDQSGTGRRGRRASNMPTLADQPTGTGTGEPDVTGNPDNTVKPDATPDADITEPEAPVCGETYTRKLKGGATKDYQCGKEPGHEGKHGPKRAVPVDTSGIGDDLLDTFEAVPGTEIVAVREADAERTPMQLKVDKQVKSAHESWVIAGKPKGFNDSPRQRYRPKTRQQAKELTAMLRKAERFVGVHVRIAPVSQHVDGGFMLVWVATDPAPRKSASNGEANATPETAGDAAPVPVEAAATGEQSGS